MPSFEEDTSLRPGWAKTTLLPLLQKHEICFRGPSIMAKGRGGEMEYFKNPSGPHLMRKNMKYVSDFSIFCCWCCNPQQVPWLTSWKVPFCQQHESGNVIYLLMLQLILKCYIYIYFGKETIFENICEFDWYWVLWFLPVTIKEYVVKIYMLNCKINGTVHIFFLKKSYLSPRCPKLSHFFFLV